MAPQEPPAAHAGGSIGTAVLGGGPAGLTGAYVLAGRGQPGRVFEAGDVVGGISRTVEVDGYRFDLGGHRFFTKLPPVARLWEDMLGEDFLERPRLSRIYYGGRFLAYPLQARDVLGRLGVAESARCALSYFAALARRSGRDAETFEEWVTARFGRRLYEAFFRSYTEKVWGIPGSEIRAEWAAQRIKDFSLCQRAPVGAAPAAVPVDDDDRGASAIPGAGPGRCGRPSRPTSSGRGSRSISARVRRDPARRRARRRPSWSNGRRAGPSTPWTGCSPRSRSASSWRACRPSAPDAVLAAARGLRYRSMCLVALMTDEPEPFPDNWIYLHDPGVRAGRVQNFGAWSPDMVPPGATCLGVEYFCFEGDDIWTMDEDEAVALAARELAAIGLIDPARVTGGVQRARAEVVPHVRRRLRRPRPDDPRLPRRLRQRADVRPQRPAPLQQPGPLHVDRRRSRRST